MAVKTFLDLCQQLALDAGISGEITNTESQQGEFLRVVRWVARATTEIEGLWFNWNFLHKFHTVSTIANVADYPQPIDLNLWDWQTFKVRDDEQQLFYVDWTRAKRRATLPQLGDPHSFTILPSKTLRLYDTPTQVQTLSMEYWSKPTALVANGDEPKIPEQFRDIIVYKALQYYANYESADESKVAGTEQYTPRLIQLEASELPAHQASSAVNTGTSIQVVAETTIGGYSYGDGY